MSLEKESINIESLTLSSSSEVESTLEKLTKESNERVVIHILSYIHNTVLVQSLKKALVKKFGDVPIVCIRHEDKTQSVVTMFKTTKEESDVPLEDLILHEIHRKYLEQKENSTNYRVQLFNRYFTDHLTNLPNVYQLRKDIQALDDYGLVLIKIDNFSTINSFYGFVIGDYVIEEIANYLKSVIKEHNVYRLSGAEFAFTLSETMSFYDLKIFLHNLYEQIKSFSVKYQSSNIFIDFTLASTASSNHYNVFSKVSMALEYAKKIGVPFWIYEDRMNFENDYERNLELSNIVREGVNNNRIIPYFQAIVDNTTGKICKYECLARLIDEEGTVLSPVLFIPIAKKIKVYNEITLQMIEKSFAAFEENELEFSINLSIEDIMSSKIFHFILEKLKNSSASNRVTFEVLESESIEDFQKIEKFITEMKRYGAKIAIDDFGSGYSNFSYLIQIKADYIKIDGSLIKNIDIDNSAHLVVETIVSFAKKLGMKTIAEYVHTSVVMDKVKELGIDYSQGFFIDEPSIRRNDER